MSSEGTERSEGSDLSGSVMSSDPCMTSSPVRIINRDKDVLLSEMPLETEAALTRVISDFETYRTQIDAILTGYDSQGRETVGAMLQKCYLTSLSACEHICLRYTVEACDKAVYELVNGELVKSNGVTSSTAVVHADSLTQAQINYLRSQGVTRVLLNNNEATVVTITPLTWWVYILVVILFVVVVLIAIILAGVAYSTRG